MKTVTETTNELKKRGRTIQILYLAFGMILAVVLIVGLGFREYIAAAVIVVLDFIWYFAWLVRQRRKFSDDVVAANVLYGVCEPLTEPEYLGKNSLSSEEFGAMEILPVHVAEKSVLTENGFKGKKDRLVLRGWEISFPYIVQGVKSSDMYHHLSGTLLTAQRDTNSAGAAAGIQDGINTTPSPSDGYDPKAEWLILHKEFINSAAQQDFLSKKQFHKADCSSAELSESFDVYSKAEDASMPEQLSKAVLKAYRQAEKIAAVRISKESAQVFVYRSFYSLRIRLRYLPDEAWYKQNLLAERDAVWSLFKTWKNNA